MVNVVLLQPLPYPDPDRLIALRHAMPNGSAGSSFLLHFTYQDESKTFTSGLWVNGSASITGLGEPEEVRAIPVTQQVLPILGVQPLLGRVFSAEDDVPGKPLTAVLTYGYWQRRFGGDPSAIGQPLTIGGRSHEIIGVMPEGFRFLDLTADLFHPLQPDRSRAELTNFNSNAVARLRPGATIAQAQADVDRMIAIAVEGAPLRGGSSREYLRQYGIRQDLRTLKEDVVGNIGNTLWVLMGTVVLVLLIACANVANLMLVRAGGRQQELAVRAAIGAAWGRIARELLVESTVLGLAGGLLGVVLAWGGLRVLVANAPGTLPRLGEISINLEVLLFALGVSLLCGLVFGMIPVLKHAGPRLATALRAAGRSMSAGREQHRARGALLITQVAIALVLLVGSGLMIRTYQALTPTCHFPSFKRWGICDASLARTSFTLLLALAGAMALLLGVIGIYGVISYSVSQRRREIGIQIALGAQHGQLRRMFVRNALALAGVGIVIGLGAAAGLTRLMVSLLFEVDPVDLPTYGAVAVVLLCAAALAGYVPARRAVRVDPIETLRAE